MNLRPTLIRLAGAFAYEAVRIPGVTRVALVGPITAAKPTPKDVDLLVTVDSIPVVSEVFPGNENDMETFPTVFNALLKRLEHLEVESEKLMLVVDRGVNSLDNFTDVLGAMHVVASLKRNEAKELFEVPQPMSTITYTFPIDVLKDFHELSQSSGR